MKVRGYAVRVIACAVLTALTIAGLRFSAQYDVPQEDEQNNRFVLVRRLEKEYDADGVLLGMTEYTYTESIGLKNKNLYDGDGTLIEREECEYTDDGRIYRKYDGNENLLIYEEHTNNQSVVEESFDENGNKVVTEYVVDNEKRIKKSEHIYDKKENLLVDKIFNLDGELSGWTEFTRDKKGRAVSEVNYNGKGKLSKGWEFTYDKKGNTLSIKEYDGYGKSKEWQYSYDKNGKQIEEKYRNGSWYERRETAYDKNGNVISKKTYNGEDELRERTEYTYDENNNRTSGKGYNKSGELKWEFYYTYDSFDRWLSIKSFYIDGTWTLEEESYDDNGNKIKRKYTDTGRVSEWWEAEYGANNKLLTSYTYDNDGALTGKIEYTYDENGNQRSMSAYNANGVLIRYEECLYAEKEQ